MEVVRSLFQNLLWPAVAGNVIWSFLTVIFNFNFHGIEYYSKIIILFSLSIYLLFGYLQILYLEINIEKNAYWISEGLHLFIISSVAVCVVSASQYVAFLIMIYFISVIISNLFDAWTRKNENKYVKRNLIITNFFGLIFVLLSFIFPEYGNYCLTIAMAGTVLLWTFWSRRDDLKDLYLINEKTNEK